VFHPYHQLNAKNEKNFLKNQEENQTFLLEDYDHVHKDKLLLGIDEVMVEDDQQDIALDHVQQWNILDNDH